MQAVAGRIFRIISEFTKPRRKRQRSLQRKFALFQNLRFKRYSEVGFSLYESDAPFLAFSTEDFGLRSEISLFQMHLVNKEIWFSGISKL